MLPEAAPPSRQITYISLLQFTPRREVLVYFSIFVRMISLMCIRSDVNKVPDVVVPRSENMAWRV